MTIRLNGSVSGYTQLDSPATGGNNTLVLPTGNGSANQALVTDGSGALSFADRGRIVQGTAQNSTSGTSIDFTGIPSWVKRVTVMFQGVSTNGTSNYLLQLGAGSIQSTGYSGSGVRLGTGTGVCNASTAGAVISSETASHVSSGHLLITSMGSNLWAISGVLGSSSAVNFYTGASVTLSGTLDRIRITTVNGTDTFDSGSINILYEG